MKTSLSLGFRQQLAMTPQLQQAIRLLQLSTLDLQREVREALETNPMLEEDTASDNDPETEPWEALDPATEDIVGGPPDYANAPAPYTNDADTGIEGADPRENGRGASTVGDGIDAAPEEPAVDTELARPIPEELPVDSDWDDIFQPAAAPAKSGAVVAHDDNHPDIDSNHSAEETLREHLLWQLNLTSMSDTDRLVAATIVDAVNPDGMLEMDIDELLESFEPALGIRATDVSRVLRQVQQFDPTGVAARSLAECLALQLEALNTSTPWRTEALAIVRDHLTLLAAGDFATLKRKTRLGEAQLAQITTLIRSLSPRPGAAIAPGPIDYVVPDVVVRRERDRWVVALNPEAAPALRINSNYAALIRRGDNSQQNTWLREHLRDARWFLKSLESRHDTLLRVARCIVEFQRGFLEHGEEAMRPLVLQNVADAVNLHESTISRVTSRKFMQTPRGLFELKYFFSSHVSTTDGDEVSSIAIRALIRGLTNRENPKKPLSDAKIAAILGQRNINVARRTVAKYRESMSIPPSNRRKRLA